jgi:hypothetical protein
MAHLVEAVPSGQFGLCEGLELVQDRPKAISVLSSPQPMDLATAISLEGLVVALQQPNSSLSSRRLYDLCSGRLGLASIDITKATAIEKLISFSLMFNSRSSQSQRKKILGCFSQAHV